MGKIWLVFKNYTGQRSLLGMSVFFFGGGGGGGRGRRKTYYWRTIGLLRIRGLPWNFTVFLLSCPFFFSEARYFRRVFTKFANNWQLLILLRIPSWGMSHCNDVFSHLRC